MKRGILALVLLAATMSLPYRAFGQDMEIPDEDPNLYSYNDEYDETQSHPLRVAAYVAHPVGYALEWLVARPFHAFISLPWVAEATGHRPHGDKVLY